MTSTRSSYSLSPAPYRGHSSRGIGTSHGIMNKPSGTNVAILGHSRKNPGRSSNVGLANQLRYWNWGLYSSNPTSGPIFDGSATSMSGNGEYIPGRGPLTLSLGSYPNVYLPSGTGGGCVTSGPFKDMTVNLGPVALPLNNGSELYGTGLDYNPRCLKRDIGGAINEAYANCTSIVNLITKNKDIWDFEMVMQGIPGSGSIGVHGGGHYTIAGDPGADVFVSPGDPAFYLHHGMIDRVWWIWQNLDPKNRLDAISGTGTFLNEPPSANTTLDTVINIGYAGGTNIAMRDLMSTTSGPFCYTYE